MRADAKRRTIDGATRGEYLDDGNTMWCRWTNRDQDGNWLDLPEENYRGESKISTLHSDPSKTILRMLFRSVVRIGLFPCKRPLNLLPTARSSSLLASSRTLSPFTPSTQSWQVRRFASSAPPSSDRLTWDEFLRIRRQRHRVGLFASIPSTALGLYGGFLYFGREVLDPTQTILTFDPFLMTGVFVLGCGLLGWLVGPTIGRGLWYMLHSQQAHLISQVWLLNCVLTAAGSSIFQAYWEASGGSIISIISKSSSWLLWYARSLYYWLL